MKGYHKMGQSQPPVTKTGKVDVPRPFEIFKRQMADEAELTATFTDDDKAVIIEGIAERMLLAGSLEDAIAEQESGMISGQDIVGLEHEVVGFDVVKSSKRDAPLGHYLRVRAVALMDWKSHDLEPGSEFTYAIGASNPVILLMKARADHRLPLEIVYREKSTGTDDNKLLLLSLVPKRVVRNK